MAKRKVGRPTKFNEQIEGVMINLFKLGKTDKEVAAIIGVDEGTINNWKKSQVKFFKSLKEAKNVKDQTVVRSLLERASGYTCKETKVSVVNGEVVETEIEKHYPPDATSMIFWLKNRMPKEWRDRIEQKVEGALTLESLVNSSFKED